MSECRSQIPLCDRRCESQRDDQADRKDNHMSVPSPNPGAGSGEHKEQQPDDGLKSYKLKYSASRRLPRSGS